MLNFIRRALISSLKGFVKKFLQLVREVDPDSGKNKSSISQISLMLHYRQLLSVHKKLPKIGDIGFRVHSQTDEDGILLYIFSIIGTTNKMCAEICAGNGIECNTANLIINHGWHGLLVDGNKDRVKEGVEFYRTNSDTKIYPPVFVHTWVTKKNVNDILLKNHYKGEIDLLSIDIDGVDYWIWDAITVVKPRIVVVEYQNTISADKALTIPYSAHFDTHKFPFRDGSPTYFGASLLAFNKLAKKKGYRLVGSNKYDYNAFFVRNDIAKRLLPEVSVKSCLNYPAVVDSMEKRFSEIKKFPWVKV